jgi:rhodanese-related sulfurtransferase
MPPTLEMADQNSLCSQLFVLTQFADHIGGHIFGSQHVPSHTLDYKMPELVRKLKDKDTVVFHCALSQQRGPGAALRYLRERERLLGAVPKTASKSLEPKAMTASGDVKGEELGSEENEEEGATGREVKEQKVYVLDRGFVGWQEKFAEDERLTEGYSKELWKDGYWF